MKNLLEILVLSTLLLPFSSLSADDFYSLHYKVRFPVPDNSTYRSTSRDNWGIVKATDPVSGANLSVYTWVGEIGREEIYGLAVEEVGIPEEDWVPVDSGLNNQGFQWWEHFKTVKDGQTIHSLAARNQFHNISYVFFLEGNPPSLYSDWFNDVEGLKDGHFFSDKYRFSMVLPEGFEFVTRERNNFGGLIGQESSSGTKMYAYGYRDDLTRTDIYDWGVRESGIPYEKWERVQSGEEEDGFLWWEKYRAESGDKTIYALCGTNIEQGISYLVFIEAANTSLDEDEDDYWQWFDSVRGLTTAESFFTKYRLHSELPLTDETEVKERDGWEILKDIEPRSMSRVYIAAHKGIISKEGIYRTGESLSSIDKSLWKLTARGGNESGFSWWEKYETAFQEYTLFGIAAQNARKDISYIALLLIPYENLEEDSQTYQGWIDSIRATE